MTKQIKTFRALAVVAIATTALFGLSAFQEQPKADPPENTSTIQPQWLPGTFTVNEIPDTVSNPQVKMDSDGNTTAAWIQNHQIFTNYRPVNTNFNAENSKQISQASDGLVSNLQLATNPSGASVTTWTSQQGDDQQVMFSTGKNGKWSTPEPVPGTQNTDVEGTIEQTVAINDQGHFAVLSKLSTTILGQSIQIAISNGTNLTSYYLQPKTQIIDFYKFALAAGPDDYFVPVWLENEGGNTARIMSIIGKSSDFGDSDRTTVTNFSTDSLVTSLAVTLDKQLRTTVAWTGLSGSGEGYSTFINAATATASNNPTFSLHPISTSDQYPLNINLATDDQGRSVVAWKQGLTINAAFSDESSNFDNNSIQTFQTLNENIGGPTLALNQKGDGVLTFYGSQTSTIAATTRISGAPFAATPTQLSQSSTINSQSLAQTAATDSHGNSIVLWNDGNAQINGRGYLATAPNFTELTVPTTSEINQPVTLLAQTTQVWPTGTTTVKWDFGDNTPAATGTNVTHTYRQTGTHTVTATATDALGNSTEKRAKIQVEATPQPPGRTPTTPSNENTTPKNEIKPWKARIFTNAVRTTKTGLAKIRLACETKTTGCTGIVNLQIKTTQRPKRKGQKPKTRMVGIGRAIFKTTAGKTKTLHIRISKPALRLLRTKKKLITRALVKTAEQTNTNTKKIILLTPPKPKKRSITFKNQ